MACHPLRWPERNLQLLVGRGSRPWSSMTALNTGGWVLRQVPALALAFATMTARRLEQMKGPEALQLVIKHNKGSIYIKLMCTTHL